MIITLDNIFKVIYIHIYIYILHKDNLRILHNLYIWNIFNISRINDKFVTVNSNIFHQKMRTTWERYSTIYLNIRRCLWAGKVHINRRHCLTSPQRNFTYLEIEGINKCFGLQRQISTLSKISFDLWKD